MGIKAWSLLFCSVGILPMISLEEKKRKRKNQGQKDKEHIMLYLFKVVKLRWEGGSHQQKTIQASVVYIFIKKKKIIQWFGGCSISKDGNPRRAP